MTSQKKIIESKSIGHQKVQIQYHIQTSAALKLLYVKSASDHFKQFGL